MSISKTIGARAKTHGDFERHASVAQAIKCIMAENHGYQLHAVMIEALDMIAHKLARILVGNPNHKDHWHDVAGYAVLVEKWLEEQDES